ncbi:MAG: RsmB/NOP family class I SAM-dependent RNA methyltransferase [Lachnospiraceae bacterium]|nr:RsmB/NOP family class I SAM-dependent RNA methyltransferase [Lachnospiraceae bacterium]
MNVPEQYMQNMQKLLGNDFDAYAASFDKPPCHGLRVNLLRKDARLRVSKLPFILGKIPFDQNAFYTDGSMNPAKHPYYAAGLYYLQEPSAMLPAACLPVEEGDVVLDLCAAPGGKATALLSKLNGTGLLLANDISASRAKALLKNLELTGAANFFVSAEKPAKLAMSYGPVFDKILVDAPCSGEGMFRRDPSLIRDWEKKGPSYYAPIQADILQEAVSMLKPGGYLLYSTCTFAPLEDEEQILKLLRDNPQLHPVPLEKTDGLSDGIRGLPEAVRAYPHRFHGEGHFLCLLQKETGDTREARSETFLSDHKGQMPNSLLTFLDQLTEPLDADRIVIKNGCVYLLPEKYEKLYRSNIRFLRTGLLLGETDAKGNFKPSQALALHLHADGFTQVLDMPLEDERIFRYLKGETVYADEGCKNGTVLFCADGYALGFASANNGQIKNRLAKGFIWQ